MYWYFRPVLFTNWTKVVCQTYERCLDVKELKADALVF